MKNLLGICIPTYKRPEHLVSCVRSINRSAGNLKIPIFISDDSADDTNSHAIQKIKKYYPNIHYQKNMNNIGIDRNILKVIDSCTCQYAWPVGEDDRLKDDAIPEVLKILNTDTATLPFLFVNYSLVNHDYSLVFKEKALDLDDDKTQEVEKYLPQRAWAIGFIGSCVINRRFWGAVLQDSYVGTYFAHVGIILEYLKGRKVHLIEKPLILNRCGGANVFSWSQQAFEVVGGWERLMMRLIPIYGESICRSSIDSFEKAHGIKSPKFLMYLRADKAYDRQTYWRYVSPSSRSVIQKKAAFLIAVTPPIIYRFARLILNHFRRFRTTLSLKSSKNYCLLL